MAQTQLPTTRRRVTLRPVLATSEELIGMRLMINIIGQLGVYISCGRRRTTVQPCYFRGEVCTDRLRIIEWQKRWSNLNRTYTTPRELVESNEGFSIRNQIVLTLENIVNITKCSNYVSNMLLNDSVRPLVKLQMEEASDDTRMRGCLYITLNPEYPAARIIRLNINGMQVGPAVALNKFEWQQLVSLLHTLLIRQGDEPCNNNNDDDDGDDDDNNFGAYCVKRKTNNDGCHTFDTDDETDLEIIEPVAKKIKTESPELPKAPWQPFYINSETGESEVIDLTLDETD